MEETVCWKKRYTFPLADVPAANAKSPQTDLK